MDELENLLVWWCALTTEERIHLNQIWYVLIQKRNEPCACGSGKKTKVCHGAPYQIKETREAIHTGMRNLDLQKRGKLKYATYKNSTD